MRPVEFRRQLVRDPAQWAFGIASRLRVLRGGGVALLSRPAFSGWITQAEPARCLTSLAIADCSQVFWIHRHDCHLYRLDLTSGAVDRLISLADCGGASGHVFGRAVYGQGRLWIHDRSGTRFLALRADTFQIIAEIAIDESVDLAQAAGRLFVLDAGGIGVYDITGRPTRRTPSDRLRKPRAIAADPAGTWVYVLDARVRRFLRFRPDGSFDSELGNFDDVSATFAPRLIAVDQDGNLFVSDGSATVHEFSPDGGYVGDTGDKETSNVTAISAMTFDAQGQLYVAAPPGIAAFSREAGIAGNAGVFCSGTLDSGSEREGAWHRVDFVADIDAGGAVDVFYASAAERELVDAVSGILERRGSIKERVAALDSIFEGRWQGPSSLRAGPTPASTEASEAPLLQRPTHSVLFRPDTKRYLWLKLVVSGLAPRAAAAVREMRVYYPRLSYLRYLPAVYQEDKLSREFLERLLSLFETTFGGLEATIDKVPDLFDPSRTPVPFLDWLAQWLDLAVEEDWPAAVKRELIARASELYRRKGTPGGLSEFIRILTGRRPVIQESFRTEQPPVLGGSAYLGSGTRIAEQPVEDLPVHRRTRLGCGSILGATEIRRETTRPVNPFAAAAHRFSVVLDISPQQFRRQARGLHRVIREQSPAHAAYDIRLVSGTVVGSDSVVGIAQVENPTPFRLGHSALGRSVCLRKVWYGPELGIDATLTGPNPTSKSASALQ
jgi:phage tail-like protein